MHGVCRFGGGFTEWRQPFRLRHMVTGKFLGVKVVHRTDGSCVGGREGRGGEEGEGLKGKIEKRHTVALLEPSEATFRASAFCFSDATVRCRLLCGLSMSVWMHCCLCTL